MYIDLPNGTSSRETNRQMQEIFVWLNNKKQFGFIENYSGYVGFKRPTFLFCHSTLKILLKTKVLLYLMWLMVLMLLKEC